MRTVVFAALALVLIGAVSPAFAQDPADPGPFAVTVQEYDFGDTAFSPSGFPGLVEVRASVHRPTTLSGGPFPLVVFLHGRHATCTNGASSFLQWPCSPGRVPIPSYQGYHYIANILASHGYIVVSISANGINAIDNSTFDLGMQARAELLQHHLDRWNTWNTTGGVPFGSTFVGRVDMDNVGTMGHSRGGEGVMRNFLYNASLGSPYGIRAVFPIAPVNFHRPVVSNVPFTVLLPYCDGDVADLQGVHYYDDARYAVGGDLAPKHTLLVMGANHNFYNTIWTPGFGFPAFDDWGLTSDGWCGPGLSSRLTAEQQRGTGLAYLTGFFRLYLGGETEFADLFTGDAAPPPSAMTSDIYPSYHAADTATARRDVNRLLDSVHLSVNQLGGAVTQTGLSPYELCGGGPPQPTHCLPSEPTSRQPHTTPSARSGASGLSQLTTGWNAASARLTNELPAGFRNVSGFEVLQFRASVNYADGRNPLFTAQDFTVRLTDGSGAFAFTTVGAHSSALFYPPGFSGPVPKVVLNTIRIPLSAFSGINLSDIRSVQFRFDRRSTGALLITDLAFADAVGGPPAPADLIEDSVSNPPATVAPGGSFSVTDTVRNAGGGAGNSFTRYFVSLDALKSGADVLLTGSRSIGPLGSGDTSTGSVSVTVPAGTAAGTYFLLACADDTGLVVESSEGNNCVASATTVAVVSGGGAPDLIVSALSNPPASALVGSSIAITDTTRNQGGSLAASSDTRFYVSTDMVKSGSDPRLVGVHVVPALPAGGTSNAPTTATIKAGTAAGTYFVIACADDTKDVAEGASGEANNCRTSTSTIVVTGPDLVETALTNPPTSRPAGGTFSVTDTVRNQGTAAAGAFTIRFYLSLNTSKGGGDVRLTGSRPVAGLLPTNTSTGTVVLTIPAATAPGTYFLLACADDTSKVPETGEKNNCRASTAQVSVTP